MKIFFYTTIFATLIASFVKSSVVSRDDDACERISIEYKRSNEDPAFSAKYSDLKACFESFPYDREIAESVKLID